jgi:hypothetical protein
MIKPLDCSIESCKDIFLQLGQYYKSAVIGGIVLLGLVLGLWTWSYAQYSAGEKIQNEKLYTMEKFQAEISFIRSDAKLILENQMDIKKNQVELEKSIQKLLSKY